MNENEFRFSEVSYHLKKPNFLKGAFRTHIISYHIISYLSMLLAMLLADFGKDMYLKRPASNANGEYNRLRMK